MVDQAWANFIPPSLRRSGQKTTPCKFSESEKPIRAMVDGILKEMSPQFAKRYADVGRPSIAPERLLRVLLLQIFYSVRSERLLMEQLQYNLLSPVVMKWPCRRNIRRAC